MNLLELEDRLAEGAWLRLEVPADDPRSDFLTVDRTVEQDGRTYRIISREEFREGSATIVRIEAEELWGELADRLRVGDTVLVNASPKQIVEFLLAGSGWTFEETDSAGDAGSYSIEGIDESVLSLLNKAAKITGYELFFLSTAKKVTLRTAGGIDRGIGFRYGKNVRSLKRRTEAPAATVLYPFGASGLTIAGQAPGGVEYVEDFSYYVGLGLTLAEARERFTRSVQWTDADFVEDGPLYAAAQAKIAELAVPIVSYEMSVADLSSITGAPEDSFRVGDLVRVRDPELDIDVPARVVRIVRRPLSPSTNEIELAYRPDLSGLSDGGSRSKDSLDWLLLNDDNEGARNVGDSWTTLLGSIPVSFTQGGNAVYGVDLEGTVSGSGTIRLTIHDEESDVEFRRWEVPFDSAVATDFSFVGHFTKKDLAVGGYYFNVRATISEGTGSVVIPAADAHFSILAQGGLGSLPRPETQTRFDHEGEFDQFFTVPDGVTSVEIEVNGAAGGPGGANYGGGGARITGRVAVTPGEVLKVRVGRTWIPSSVTNTGGWPGGGSAGDGTGTSNGYNGGGYSAVLRAPYREVSPSEHDFLLVGGGGGGSHDNGLSFGIQPVSGAGGFPNGATGASLGTGPSGGMQDGPGPTGNKPGSWLQGGDGGTGYGTFVFPEGGGGGGWYGGNADTTKYTANNYGSDGGGGSSYFNPDEVAAIVEEGGANRTTPGLPTGSSTYVAGNGYVIFRYETPSA